jgi:hypothetical protein
MKYLLLVLLTLSAVSCATHENRQPSSEEMSDVSRGLNTDSYGIPAAR